MQNQALTRLAPTVPVIFQNREDDCGIACLAMIADYFAVTARCKQRLSPSRSSGPGLTIGKLVHLAHTFGLSTSTHRPTWDALETVSVPSVLHWRNNHFVVLVQANRLGVTIHDPQHGVVSIDWRTVRKRYSGACIEFSMPAFSGWPEKFYNYPCERPCLTLTPQAGTMIGFSKRV